MVAVVNAVGGDRRMMASESAFPLLYCRTHAEDLPDLLADQLRGSCLIHPSAKKQFTQERIQRLLLTTQVLVATTVLLLQSTQKPNQDEECALSRVLFLDRCDEDGGVFSPVAGVFDEGDAAEDEGWCCEGGEIARKGGDGLLRHLLAIAPCRVRGVEANLEERGPRALGRWRH
jgi:hypothetical protein